MSSIDEIRNLRIKKLDLLREKGFDPYPASSKREISLNDVLLDFENLEKSKTSAAITNAKKSESQ